MNIILTDDQFAILKEDILKEFFKKNEHELHSYMRVTKRAFLDSSEIRDIIKKNTPNELKELIISKVNIEELVASVGDRVVKHSMSKIENLITRKINFNIEAKLQLEQENV